VFATIPCSGTACSGNVWWATGALAPAAYEVQAVATDTAGNTKTSAKVVIYFLGNGTEFAQVSRGNATTCSSAEWWVTGSPPSGQQTITVVATDTAGNQKTSAPVMVNK